MSYKHTLCWFRRDLRLHDHAALSQALQQSEQVYCVFVFDTDILLTLKNKQDRRVEFIWHAVNELRSALAKHGAALHVLYGSARTILPQLAEKLGIEAVFCNRDYEPQAIQRDREVAVQLDVAGIAFHDSKDQVIFEQAEILNGSGLPYAVFTPYKNAWLKRLSDADFQKHLLPLSRLAQQAEMEMPTLKEIGFAETDLLSLHPTVGMSGATHLLDDFMQRMDRYHETRDFPGVKGVSFLSPHLRFGTLSIRQLVRMCHQRRGERGADIFLSELIWREFYQMLLFHHPQLAAGHTYKPVYDRLPFSNDAQRFEKWAQGKTGYPLIDSGMRQLMQTGFMHNRLRMLTASFLVKDLDVDWRWGERHFAEWLLDFDLAANNGGWQWAASTGCDAQPWFRIFNPVTQSKKFDSQGKFIRRFVPELKDVPDKYIHQPWLLSAAQQALFKCRIGADYALPLVDHALARNVALQRYAVDRNI
jgi:deoxyribodipyrimidine photo-lyase